MYENKNRFNDSESFFIDVEIEYDNTPQEMQRRRQIFIRRNLIIRG